MTSIWRRLSVVIASAICLGTASGCGVLDDPPDAAVEAERNARDVVARIVAELRSSGSGTRTTDEIGRELAASAEADLLSISGVDTAHPAGVTAVLRIEGRGFNGSWREPERVVQDFCFELRFRPTAPPSPPAVPCPSPAARMTFPPLATPKLPSPEQVRAALSASAADEAGVRALLAGLSLDPAIRVDVEIYGEAVGVALRASQGSDRYDCVLARKRPGTVDAWRPAASQLQPGELACVASEGLAGNGMTPPK